MLTLIFVSLLFSARSALTSPQFSSPWNNYCNAPHVNASHYQLPEEGAELVHLTVMMRHHKVMYRLPRIPCSLASQTEIVQRAPIALVPDELSINDGIPWDCSGVKQFTYDGRGARLSHSVYTPLDHPFARQMWAGGCEVGQLTQGGFHDSKVHGKVKRCYDFFCQHGMTRLPGPLGTVSRSPWLYTLRLPEPDRRTYDVHRPHKACCQWRPRGHGPFNR